MQQIMIGHTVSVHPSSPSWYFDENIIASEELSHTSVA